MTVAKVKKSYWEDRIAKETWKTYNSLEEQTKGLLDLYNKAEKRIKDDLYAIAEKYIKENGQIHMDDLKHFGRKSALQTRMKKELQLLGQQLETMGYDNMIQGYRAVYENIQMELNVPDFTIPNKKAIEKVIDHPWHGSNFSKRVWGNTNLLAESMNKIMVDGIIQGKSIIQMAMELHNKMNKGFNQSIRLVRTETMHVLNEATLSSYRDSGVKQVEYLAAYDERVCEICGGLQGKIYPINKTIHIPVHPNCRCTWLPVIEDDPEFICPDNMDDFKHTNLGAYINNEFNLLPDGHKKILKEYVKGLLLMISTILGLIAMSGSYI